MHYKVLYFLILIFIIVAVDIGIMFRAWLFKDNYDTKTYIIFADIILLICGLMYLISR
jgi:hypothetical protein